MTKHELWEKVKHIITTKDFLFFLLGIFCTLLLVRVIYLWHMDNAIALNGIVYKHIVYDLKVRP